MTNPLSIYTILPEQDVEELLERAVQVVHDTTCPYDGKNIALYLDGPLVDNHSHMPDGSNPQIGEIASTRTPNGAQIFYEIVACYGRIDIQDLLESYDLKDRLIGSNPPADFIDRLDRFTVFFYFLRFAPDISREDLVDAGDEMRYTAPNDPTKADEEMLEWDRILHPEKYSC